MGEEAPLHFAVDKKRSLHKIKGNYILNSHVVDFRPNKVLDKFTGVIYYTDMEAVMENDLSRMEKAEHEAAIREQIADVDGRHMMGLPPSRGMNPVEIRKAVNAACYGRGPYVFGMDNKGKWHRITQFRVKRGREYGKALSDVNACCDKDGWFVMYGWETR